MPQEDIAVILERIDGLIKLIDERFNYNDKEHAEIKQTATATVEYQKIQNGNVARLVEFKNKQEQNNRWMYGICTLIIIPVVFLIIKELI